LNYPIYHSMLFINFFFLAFALLWVYYYAHRLRNALKLSDKLAKSTEKYKTLFNTTAEGILISDLKGNIMLLNESGARILGYMNLEEFHKDPVTTNDLWVDHEKRDQVRGILFKGGEIKDQTMKLKHKSGEVIYVEGSANIRKDDVGKIIGLEAIFRDVTKRIDLENQLKNYSETLEDKVEEKTRQVLLLEHRKSELEKLADLGEMAAMIVHEIRNPLSSIKVGLTALLNRSRLQVKDRQCLELAAKEVSHLERILKDLLSFSSNSAVKGPKQDPNRILEISLNQLRSDFEKSGITIKYHLSSVPQLMRMNADRMRQVFDNLLLNALQAMPNGGIVTVRSEKDSFNKCINIEIVDEGEGIKKKDFNHLFEPFFSTKAEGTGLGLTIVKKIVEAYGGSVSIESRTGKGTKVKVNLPTDIENCLE